MGWSSHNKEPSRSVSPSSSATSSSSANSLSRRSNVSVGSGVSAPADRQSHITALSRADAQFQDTFNNGSYTSLVMLDFLMTKRDLSYKDLLLDGTIILDRTDYQEYCTRISAKKQCKDAEPDEFFRTKAWLREIPDSEFSILVNNGTGRCTSFAIQTVSRLDRRYPGNYSFNYYKLGVHHLARCAQSGIVIDSSSKKGAFFLQPGQEMSVISVDQDYSNKWVFLSPSCSRFTKTRRGSNNRPTECEAPEPTSWREAIHNCLIDMACRQQFLIYFRAYDEANQPQYYGMIKFNLHNMVRIALAQMASAKHPPLIVFGRGNQQTDRDCRSFLAVWVDDGYNGYSYREQYQKCESVVQKIWAAATTIHGYPQLTQSTLNVPMEGARTAMAGIWTPGMSS